MVWTFSTTLLQLNTDDQYRGQIFSADLGICMATIALTAWAASAAIDAAVPVRLLAACTGAAILVPCAAWGLASGCGGEVGRRSCLVS